MGAPLRICGVHKGGVLFLFADDLVLISLPRLQQFCVTACEMDSVQWRLMGNRNDRMCDKVQAS